MEALTMRVIATKIISLALIVLFTFKGCTVDTEEKLYPIGRDTVASFGTGQYAIMKLWNEDELYWSLENLKTGETIEYMVYNYKEVENYVYVVGYYGYTKLNYETGEYQKEENMEVYSAEDQAIFEEVERTRYIADAIREQQDYRKKQ